MFVCDPSILTLTSILCAAVLNAVLAEGRVRRRVSLVNMYVIGMMGSIGSSVGSRRDGSNNFEKWEKQVVYLHCIHNIQEIKLLAQSVHLRSIHSILPIVQSLHL